MGRSVMRSPGSYGVPSWWENASAGAPQVAQGNGCLGEHVVAQFVALPGQDLPVPAGSGEALVLRGVEERSSGRTILVQVFTPGGHLS